MSIKRDLTSGVFYTSIAKYSGIVISLIITSVLARLLTPEDFGLVAVATVIIAFFNILGDIGIGPAIIQHNDLDKEDLNQIYSFTIYLGVGLSIVFAFLAYPISKIYCDKALIGICQWLSMTIFFTCINIVPINLRYKNKEFKRIAFVTLGVQAVTGGCSILYAYYGGGVYALVLSSVLSSASLAIIYNYLAKLQFRCIIRFKSFRKIMSFSTFQFLFNIVAYFSRNLDKLLIGKYIDLVQLGYYEKSYRLMMLPLQNITYVITPVMLPVFSELQSDRKSLGQKYFKLIKLLAYVSFSLSIILFGCARELVLFVFGSQWEESIIPFQILTFTVAFQILTSTTGSIYQAVGATKQMFISGCWGAFFMATSFFITIFHWHTIEAVCYGYLVAQIANTTQCFWLLFKIIEIPITKIAELCIRPLVISGGLLLVYYIYSLHPLILPLFLSLVAKGVLGLVVSIVLIQLISPYNLIGLVKNFNQGKSEML